MDQRELMRPGDGSNPDRFTIVLVMHLRDPDNLMKESREFGTIVNDWYKAREPAAERINLIAVSDPFYHRAIKDWLEELRTLDVTLRPIFDKVEFTLALHNSQGSKLSEYTFAPGEFTRGGAVEDHGRR